MFSQRKTKHIGGNVIYDHVTENYISDDAANEEDQIAYDKSQASNIAIAGAPDELVEQDTPEKSELYYKIVNTYNECVDSIKKSWSGTYNNSNIHWEKFIQSGVQVDDWIYYNSSGGIITSEIYRKNIPIKNYAFYPNGQVACACIYNPKTYDFEITLYDPFGKIISHNKRNIYIINTRANYTIIQKWHNSGHLKSETPTFAIIDYTSPDQVFSNSEIQSYGVYRTWFNNGELQSEKFYFDKLIFERTWNKSGKCTCNVNTDNYHYSEIDNQKKYVFTINNHKYKSFNWFGRFYVIASNRDNKYNIIDSVLEEKISNNKSKFIDCRNNIIMIKDKSNITITKLTIDNCTYTNQTFNINNGFIHGRITYTNNLDQKFVCTYGLDKTNTIIKFDKNRKQLVIKINKKLKFYGIKHGLCQIFKSNKCIKSEEYVNGVLHGKSTILIGRNTLKNIIFQRGKQISTENSHLM